MRLAPALLLCALLGGCGEKKFLEDVRHVRIAPAALEVSATQLVEEYRANEVRADQTYKGKVVVVAGRIQEVKKDLAGHPLVILAPGKGHGFTTVRAVFDKQAADAVAALEKDQETRIKGMVQGKFGTVNLTACVPHSGSMSTPETEPSSDPESKSKLKPKAKATVTPQSKPKALPETRSPGVANSATRPLPLAPPIIMKNGAYNPWTRRCSDPKAPVRRGMYIRQPKPPGRYPLFVFLIGTLRRHDSVTAKRLVDLAAARGFVAAAVDYDTIATVFGASHPCQGMEAKAACTLVDGAAEAPESALGLLCSDRRIDGTPAGLKADCDRGIVLAGFSQGAVLAMLGRNYDPRVRAVWAIGHHGQALVDKVPMDCLHEAPTGSPRRRELPASRLRVVVGEGDQMMRRPHRDHLHAVTGRHCPGASGTCLAEDGSGWAIIPNAECGGSCPHEYLDSEAFWDPTRSWGAAANLAWLARFVD